MNYYWRTIAHFRPRSGISSSQKKWPTNWAAVCAADDPSAQATCCTQATAYNCQKRNTQDPYNRLGRRYRCPYRRCTPFRLVCRMRGQSSPDCTHSDICYTDL